MEFGWRIPSYTWPDLDYPTARALVPYCAQVEERGFASLWVIDHLLLAPTLYSVSWLEPLSLLAAAAAVTSRVRLGPAILVLPLRNPALLAKELATLDYLSGGRVILGVGTGYDDAEFRAIGVPRPERGRRTDEAMELVQRLLSEDSVTFDGAFYRAENLTIEPRPKRPIPVWTAGGAQVYVVDNPDKPYVPRSVLARIARSDGWICRGGGSSLEYVRTDWQVVQDHLRAVGRDPSSLTFAHAQWTHLVPTTDRSRVIAEQLAAFRRVMDPKRSDEDLIRSYLFGTFDDIVERIQALAKLGLQHLIVNPMINDPAQIDLFATEIAACFATVPA